MINLNPSSTVGDGFFVFRVLSEKGVNMKIKIEKNEIRKKQRHTWHIKPYTRVMDDFNKYDRSVMKKTTRELLSEEDYSNEE